jgi:hypothetical protein
MCRVAVIEQLAQCIYAQATAAICVVTAVIYRISYTLYKDIDSAILRLQHLLEAVCKVIVTTAILQTCKNSMTPNIPVRHVHTTVILYISNLNLYIQTHTCRQLPTVLPRYMISSPIARAVSSVSSAITIQPSRTIVRLPMYFVSQAWQASSLASCFLPATPPFALPMPATSSSVSKENLGSGSSAVSAAAAARPTPAAAAAATPPSPSC